MNNEKKRNHTYLFLLQTDFMSKICKLILLRTLIGGGVFIHIFMFCPSSFFWNQIQIYQFEKKLVGQNMNIWINTPPPLYTLATTVILLI